MWFQPILQKFVFYVSYVIYFNMIYNCLDYKRATQFQSGWAESQIFALAV